MRSTRVRRRGERASVRVCEASPGRPPPREPRIPARRGRGSRCPSLPGVRRGPSFECLPFRGGGVSCISPVTDGVKHVLVSCLSALGPTSVKSFFQVSCPLFYCTVCHFNDWLSGEFSAFWIQVLGHL